MVARPLFAFILLLAAGCATLSGPVTHSYEGCRRVVAEGVPAGWSVWGCPRPFAVLGMTSDAKGYGAGSSWRNAFTDTRTKEIFIREGYSYLLPHELRHMTGWTHD